MSATSIQHLTSNICFVEWLADPGCSLFKFKEATLTVFQAASFPHD
jgi:hypothetical protein